MDRGMLNLTQEEEDEMKGFFVRYDRNENGMLEVSLVYYSSL